MDLDKLRKWDAEALNIWVHRNYDDIYRLLRHLTRHVETAEDLAQQTFLKAIQALPSYRGEASHKTWLSRIAFREYIAWRRKRRLLFPLELRPWRTGDRIRPLGLGGSKLVSDVLIDAKVPMNEKDGVYVLVSGDSVVWVVGHRIAEGYQLMPETRTVFHITRGD